MGKTLRGTVEIWDSSLAGVAMAWAKRHGGGVFDHFLGEAYPRFWRRELDIEEVGVLETELQAAGAGIDGFRAFAGGPDRSSTTSWVAPPSMRASSA